MKSPTGLERDPFDRLIVVDSGNGRLDLFAPAAQGNVFMESIGKTGSAAGQFNDPTGAALAPGAMLYVTDTGNGRVVRLRYDDADADGVLDDRDNCKGLANPDQTDTERDGLGDACDPDVDDDGVPNAQIRCPLTHRGPDPNHEGCGDPRSRISGAAIAAPTPRGSRPPRSAAPPRATPLGAEAVRVAVARASRGGPSWLGGTAA